MADLEARTQEGMKSINARSHWSIPNVFGTVGYEVDKELSESMTHAAHVESARKAIAEGTSRTPTGKEAYKILETVYDNRGNWDSETVAEFRETVGQWLKDTYLFTLTVDTVRKKGSVEKDCAEHCIPDAIEKVEGTLVGKDGYMTKLDDVADYCEMNLGTRGVNKVNDVLKWYTGKEAYACRLNGRSLEDEKLVLALGVNYDYFGDYGCIVNGDCFLDVRPALRVRPVAQKNSP